MEKNKGDKYIIYVLLIIIIIATICLIIKENQRKKYDEKEYARVYEEVNEILNSTSTKDNKNNSVLLTNSSQEKTKKEIKKVSSILEIEKINMFYPIIQEMNMENLKIAPTKLCGPEANEIGNYCIVGHNYHNDEQFSRLKELQINDLVRLTNKIGQTVNYYVSDKYEIIPTDLKCIEQNTNGKKVLTLITCTNDSKKRLVVKCTEK